MTMARTQDLHDGLTPSEADHLIGRNVAAAMARGTVKGKDLALKVGLDPTGLSARLHGHTPFKGHELALIANELNVAPSVFFDGFPLRTQLTLTTAPGAAQLTFDDELDIREHEPARLVVVR